MAPVVALPSDAALDREGTRLAIGGEHFTVGELSWDQLMLISLLFEAILEETPAEEVEKALGTPAERAALLKQAQSSLTADGPPSEDGDAPAKGKGAAKGKAVPATPTGSLEGIKSLEKWLKLALLLLRRNRTRFPQLWAIVLDKVDESGSVAPDTAEWCRKNVTPRVVLQLVTAVRDHNDPAELIAGFRGAFKGWWTRGKPANQPASS